MRRGTALLPALLLASAAFAYMTGQVLLAMVASGLGLVAGARRASVDLSPPVQSLLLLGAGGVSALFALGLSADAQGWGGRIHENFVLVGGAALLTMAVRLHAREPVRGDATTLLMGFMVLLSSGRGNGGAPFLGLAAAQACASWWAVRALEGRPASGADVPRKHLVIGAVLLGMSVLLAAGGVRVLRVAYDRSTELAVELAGQSGRVGFGDGNMRLGSLEGLVQSDRVVLRVHGALPSHLRGQAYTLYSEGVWVSSGDGPGVLSHLGGALSDEAVEIEVVADTERLFLPLEAVRVDVEPPRISLDALGTPVALGPGLEALWFEVGKPPRFPPAPPTERDLVVPSDLAPRIGALASSWTAGIEEPRARLDAVLRHLEQDYAYSLHFDRSGPHDPVVQFLFEDKQGHCEYFASAMALLARSSGVPARVVTGYRPSERHPWLGYGIVRDRDAHAWVEVFLDGAWVTLDPSPATSFEATGPRPGGVAMAIDGLRMLVARYGTRAVLVLLVVVFVAQQVQRIRARRTGVRPAATGAGPPPDIAELLRVLEAVEPRKDSESLEAYASRIGEVHGDVEAASVLREHAAWTYGDLGNRGSIETRARALARSRRVGGRDPPHGVQR